MFTHCMAIPGYVYKGNGKKASLKILIPENISAVVSWAFFKMVKSIIFFAKAYKW